MSAKKKTAWRGVIAVILLATAFYLGFLAGGGRDAGSGGTGGQTDEAAAEEQVWTCSMHPQIRQPKFGLCPICAMDLIPVESGSAGSGNPRELILSPQARKLAAIETAAAERRFAEREVRMIGKVDYDETRIGTITAWVPGRIDRLFANYTGVPVKKGEHLVSLYSPELLTAQTELIQALDALESLGEDAPESMRTTARDTVEAVRRKLKLLGLTDEQIAAIEERGTTTDHLTINASLGGIVVEKNAVEGVYVRTGTPIYTIADLTQVWVKLEAYESDIAWLRYGQEVEFETEAYPGETFKGKVAFIDPVLDEKTRTASVRVNVPNEDGRLMPGLFVRAVVRVRMTSGGRIMNADLAGKWISPMHPEVVKDGPGECDVCGMPLVPAESLGYADPEASEADAPLLIPVTAPLVTGRRAVVYVAVPGQEGTYNAREVVLGPRAGGDYVVARGLDEGDRVVVNGNFKVDSAIQILAGPSMMSSSREAGPPLQKGSDMPAEKFDTPAAFREQLDGVIAAYHAVHFGLSRDNLEKAQAAATAFKEVLGGVDRSLLDGIAHHAWMKDSDALGESAGAVAAAAEIGKARENFSVLSESLIAAVRRYGTGGSEPLHLVHCPMAFDWRGANWLQNHEDVENPYFGDTMFMCGEVKETLAAGPAADDGEGDQ